MGTEIGSLKKVAVLAGVTMLVGGAEISSANAEQFPVPAQNFGPISENNDYTLQLDQFDPSLGTLFGVSYALTGSVEASGEDITSFSIDVMIEIQSTPSANLYNVTLGPSASTSIPVTFTNQNGLIGAADLNFYTGLGSFDVLLSLGNGTCFVGSDSTECAADWNGTLSVTYDYTPAVSEVPLPGALPMFATGLGALGLLGMRKRRKQKTKEQA